MRWSSLPSLSWRRHQGNKSDMAPKRNYLVKQEGKEIGGMLYVPCCCFFITSSTNVIVSLPCRKIKSPVLAQKGGYFPGLGLRRIGGRRDGQA